MRRVERQTIEVRMESVYDLRMHAGLCVAFTTGKMYGGTSLVCRRWCNYCNQNILVLHHTLQITSRMIFITMRRRHMLGREYYVNAGTPL